MARVIGAKKHADRLKRLTGPEMVREVGKALYVAGDMIKVEAQISITSGAVSGKGHVASKPGEPPKNDSGVLANSIETALVEPLKVEVSSNAPYSAALEFGTSKMSERPFMRPAVQKKRQEAVQLVRGAVKRVINRA